MIYKSIFNEINEILLENIKPSEDIKRLIKDGKFNKEPLNLISKLENINQNKKYHPEGNVLNHVLLVIDKASEYKKYSKNKQVFMWSAFLHDIGKLTTTKIRKNTITSYNHDIEGEYIAFKFLGSLTEDVDFKNRVSKLVRWHMQPLFYDKNLPFFEPKKMLSSIDYEEVALLSLCDRLGRGELNIIKIKEEENRIKNFKEYCSKF
ncbi:MAG: HD domain-containing protein [Romboutsia sp.]